MILNLDGDVYQFRDGIPYNSSKVQVSLIIERLIAGKTKAIATQERRMEAQKR